VRVTRRASALALTSCAISLALAAAAAGGGSAVKVSLRVMGGTSLLTGQDVALTATARLPAGDSLAIWARRASSTKLLLVVRCRRSRCLGRWRETRAERVAFVAAVAGRKLDGQSRVIVVTWRTPPPPPPPPPTLPPRIAEPGHYQGMDSQNETFAFDVAADGRSILDITTGQVNKSCAPDVGFYLSGGRLSLPGPYPIDPDGTFSVIASPTNVYQFETATIAGRFSGAGAAGTLVVVDRFSNTTCSSGDQTWTVTRTG
jgi:hypothetical protein